jgi:CHAT domain/Effector-associated domain 9
MSDPALKTILFLAANPKGTTPLRLDQEMRDIAEGLQRSQHREQFRLEQRWATRPRDVQRALLDCQPYIVHFSGHGAGEEGLALESDNGTTQLVDATALARLFELFAHHIGCIVLNACHSDLQATAIAQHIPHVIGMKQAIGDRAAMEFSIGFYDALGAGQPIEFAYKLGCSAIRMSGIPEELTPTLQPIPLTAQNPSPISISPVLKPLTPAQKRRLEQRQQTLEVDYNLRDRKLKEIRKALAIATGAASKFELQQQIQDEETALITLADELESIERSLSS